MGETVHERHSGRQFLTLSHHGEGAPHPGLCPVLPGFLLLALLPAVEVEGGDAPLRPRPARLLPGGLRAGAAQDPRRRLRGAAGGERAGEGKKPGLVWF